MIYTFDTTYGKSPHGPECAARVSALSPAPCTSVCLHMIHCLPRIRSSPPEFAGGHPWRCIIACFCADARQSDGSHNVLAIEPRGVQYLNNLPCT